MERLLQFTLASGSPRVKWYSLHLLSHEEAVVTESPWDAPYVQPNKGSNSRGFQIKNECVLLLRDDGLEVKDKWSEGQGKSSLFHIQCPSERLRGPNVRVYFLQLWLCHWLTSCVPRPVSYTKNYMETFKVVGNHQTVILNQGQKYVVSCFIKETISHEAQSFYLWQFFSEYHQERSIST